MYESFIRWSSSCLNRLLRLFSPFFLVIFKQRDYYWRKRRKKRNTFTERRMFGRLVKRSEIKIPHLSLFRKKKKGIKKYPMRRGIADPFYSRSFSLENTWKEWKLRDVTIYYLGTWITFLGSTASRTWWTARRNFYRNVGDFYGKGRGKPSFFATRVTVREEKFFGKILLPGRGRDICLVHLEREKLKGVLVNNAINIASTAGWIGVCCWLGWNWVEEGIEIFFRALRPRLFVVCAIISIINDFCNEYWISMKKTLLLGIYGERNFLLEKKLYELLSRAITIFKLFKFRL